MFYDLGFFGHELHDFFKIVKELHSKFAAQ